MTEIKLEDILDKKHVLYRLANCINWEHLINELSQFYSGCSDQTDIPIRVIAGLNYLKYLEKKKDESVIEKFCENPYWQYFCGFKVFQHKFPYHPTILLKCRKHISEKGLEKLLIRTISSR